MSLPSYLKNNQSGQVLVIFLLVLVIGLALVLSIASRTVTDIRQTTTSDESNRAYFAAESGVESALKKIESDAGFITDTAAKKAEVSPKFTDVNRATADVDVKALTAPAGQILDFLDYNRDEVAQISMMGNFNDLSTRGAIPTTGILNLYWGDETKTYTGANVPAIEISFVTFDGTNWGMRKMTFDPSSRNGFCGSTSAASGTKYEYRVRLNTLATPPCSPTNEGVNNPGVLARVRFLYNTEKIPFGVMLETSALPQQGQLITSVGETPSGVTRKLEVRQFYPTLPAIFDYVLYNGSTQPLCKGSC
jgi:hypothetical protein